MKHFSAVFRLLSLSGFRLIILVLDYYSYWFQNWVMIKIYKNAELMNTGGTSW